MVLYRWAVFLCTNDEFRGTNGAYSKTRYITSRYRVVKSTFAQAYALRLLTVIPRNTVAFCHLDIRRGSIPFSIPTPGFRLRVSTYVLLATPRLVRRGAIVCRPRAWARKIGSHTLAYINTAITLYQGD